MAWVKVDDGFPEHPKVIDLELPALGLWLAGLCYANRQMTDGRLPAGFIRRAGPEAPVAAAQLVAAGLWDEDAAGYQIHDYLEHQRSREQIESTAAKRAEAGRSGGQAKSKQNASKPEAPDEQNPSQVQPEKNKKRIEPEREPDPSTTNIGDTQTPRARATKSAADAAAAGPDLSVSSDENPPASAPYRLFQALCETTGADESSVPAAYKKKQLGVAKRLLADYSEADVIACLGFIGSQSWRTGPSDLLTVEKAIGPWAISGKPPRERGRTEPRAERGHDRAVL